MAECLNCEYHKNRAARWRAEAYKQAGHDVIELPWVGLTDEEVYQIYGQVEKEVGDHWEAGGTTMMFPITLYQVIEAKLKEKNSV